MRGQSPYIDHFGLYPDSKLGTGTYDQVLMERVNRLWARLYPVFHSSTTSLSACGCLRLGRADVVRPNHQKPEPAWSYSICVKFKIERSTRFQARKNRKRAKRAWLGSAADKVYWDYQLRWHKLLLWIRVHLLFCRCNRTEPGSRARLERQNVKHCVALAREGLKKRGSFLFRERPSTVSAPCDAIRAPWTSRCDARQSVARQSQRTRCLTKFVMERLSANHTTRNL